ncbi:MAG: tetratricopeptide repeat protein [Chloroflexota bacterium]
MDPVTFGTVLAWLCLTPLQGILGNRADAAVMNAIARRTKKSWTDLYLSAFEEVLTSESEFGLTVQHLKNTQDIQDIKPKLQELLEQELEIDLQNVTYEMIQDTHWIDTISQSFVEKNILDLSPDQLHENEYARLIRLVIESATNKFKLLVQTDDEAFRRVVIDYLEVISEGQTTSYYAVAEELKKAQMASQNNQNQENSIFYEGGAPDWQDIQAHRDAERDIEEDIIDFVDFSNDFNQGRIPFGLVLGRAGEGKSTLLMRVAAILSQEKYIVLWHRASSQNLYEQVLVNLPRLKDKKRIILCVDNIHRFSVQEMSSAFTDFKRERIPVTVLASARTSIWRGKKPKLETVCKFEKFELGDLTDSEVTRLLDKLKAAKALGKLGEYSREKQIEIIKNKSKSQLLVVLIEAKYGAPIESIVSNSLDDLRRNFDSVVVDACLLVSTAHTFELTYKEDQLKQDLPISSVRREITSKTKGLLIGPQTGHTGLKTRHSLIAAIVFKLDSDGRFDNLQTILNMTSVDEKHLHLDILQRLLEEFDDLLTPDDLSPYDLVELFNNAYYGESLYTSIVKKLGEYLIDINALAEASELLERGIDLYPENSYLVGLSISVALKRDNVEAARNAAKQAVKIIPDAQNIWAKWIELELAVGDMESARIIARDATEAAPKNQDIWVKRIDVELAVGDMESARAVAREATDAVPKYQETWVKRIDVELAVGDMESARTIARDATEAAPKNQNTWMKRIDVELAVGDMESARAIARDATEVAPKHQDTWMKRIDVELAVGDMASARAVAREATDAVPKYHATWLKRINVELAVGDMASARAIAKDATDALSADKNVWSKRMNIEWDMANDEQLRDLIEQAVKNVPNYLTLRQYQLAFERKVGNLEQVRLLKRSLIV